MSVAELPLHMIPSLPAVPEVSVTEMEARGNEETVMVVDAVAEQLLALVTVTVYVVLDNGETVMAVEVDPVLHA